MRGPREEGASDDAVLVVFNPAAGGGRAERWRPLLRRAVDEAPVAIHWVETEGPGHAESLVRRWRHGIERVVAVGGDGTVHEVVNGLLDVDELDRTNAGSPVALGVVHLGTGGDYRRGLRSPRGWRDQLELALTGTPVLVDVLRVDLEGLDGTPRRRISANVAGAGMNGRVVELANQSNKEWGGLATFAWATVQAVIERPLADVEVEWIDESGGTHRWDGCLAASFFANGAYCGNGMWLGRGGSLRDGQLEMTLIPDIPLLQMLFQVPKLYAGTVDRVRRVVRSSMSTVTMSSPNASVTVDLDGELAGRLPLKIRVVPNVLRVVAGTADL